MKNGFSLRYTPLGVKKPNRSRYKCPITPEAKSFGAMKADLRCQNLEAEVKVDGIKIWVAVDSACLGCVTDGLHYSSINPLDDRPLLRVHLDLLLNSILHTAFGLS